MHQKELKKKVRTDRPNLGSPSARKTGFFFSLNFKFCTIGTNLSKQTGLISLDVPYVTIWSCVGTTQDKNIDSVVTITIMVTKTRLESKAG